MFDMKGVVEHAKAESYELKMSNPIFWELAYLAVGTYRRGIMVLLPAMGEVIMDYELLWVNLFPIYL